MLPMARLVLLFCLFLSVAGNSKAEPANPRPTITSGKPPNFKIDSGWERDEFPGHAVCHKSPGEIAKLFGGRITSYDRPHDGSLRIVGTGHSFMVPGYRTLPAIAKAAGFNQPPMVTHTGGGITGSARYKWEQENGIFQFDGRPRPKLLAAISNAQWDVMLWGPYYRDRPEFYACWIDFCLKYNPKMKFYVMNAWPQIGQLEVIPRSEEGLSAETVARMGALKHRTYVRMIGELNEKYDDRVYVLPTCEAMVLAVEYYHRGELPGVEGIHSLVGGKKRTLWRDRIGHLGPGFANLEGYVFYATLYGRSPELIEGDVEFGGPAGYPSRELDRVFRKIAWTAVANHPLTRVVDRNENGIGDDRE